MNFKIGDVVSRKSYNNDIVFRIIKIEDDVVFLQGINVRLSADSNINDIVPDNLNISDDEIINRNLKLNEMDRSNYFYLPGKILHVDGDDNYLDRCMKFYKSMGLKANGIALCEDCFSSNIKELIEKYRPDILVITGHDAYYSKKNDKSNLNNYQNTSNFIDAIKVARAYEKSQDKLIIIAGACQSNYEELIKAGANFASSPKRVNIHALDPAIIAVTIALTERTKEIDLINLLKRTKYGEDGMGGLIGNGLMYVGYPR